jgi:hypothetical protein
LDHLLVLVVSTFEKLGSACYGSSAWRILPPSRKEPIAVWWLNKRKAAVEPSCKSFDTLVWLVAWSLWKERNRHVHERAALQLVALAGDIMEAARLWARAGFVSIAALLGFRRRVGSRCVLSVVLRFLGPRAETRCCILIKLLSS